MKIFAQISAKVCGIGIACCSSVVDIFYNFSLTGESTSSESCCHCPRTKISHSKCHCHTNRLCVMIAQIFFGGPIEFSIGFFCVFGSCLCIRCRHVPNTVRPPPALIAIAQILSISLCGAFCLVVFRVFFHGMTAKKV